MGHRHLPAGLGALLCYTLSVSLIYDRLGLLIGTLVGFAAATAWLLAWTRLLAWRSTRGARQP